MGSERGLRMLPPIALVLPMIDQSCACPVCASRYTVRVQDVVGARTGNLFAQRFCMDCQSFFHKSNYVEDDARLREDFAVLLADADRHYRLMAEMCLQLITRRPHIGSVLDVGHGSGQLMRAFVDFGREARGVEVNRYCHDYVMEHLSLPTELGLLEDLSTGTFDLITAIHVFEHLEEPRKLFSEMVGRLKPEGCIFISVPFVTRQLWPFLWTAGSKPGLAPPDPFFDNDVHVTHFSVEGLIAMGRLLGARSAEVVDCRDVVDESPGSYRGVLFGF